MQLTKYAPVGIQVAAAVVIGLIVPPFSMGIGYQGLAIGVPILALILLLAFMMNNTAALRLYMLAWLIMIVIIFAAASSYILGYRL
jgi:hypothetical protein